MVELLQVAEVVHPLRHPVGDDEEAATAGVALVELRLQLVEEDDVVVDVLDVLDRDAGLAARTRRWCRSRRGRRNRASSRSDLASRLPALRDVDLLASAPPPTSSPPQAAIGRSARRRDRAANRAMSQLVLCIIVSLLRSSDLGSTCSAGPPARTRSRPTCMCSGAQLSRTARAASGQALRARPRRRSGTSTVSRHVVRQTRRRSASRCPGYTELSTMPSTLGRARRSPASDRCAASPGEPRRGSARPGRTRSRRVSQLEPAVQPDRPALAARRGDGRGHQVGDPDEAGDEGGRRALVDAPPASSTCSTRPSFITAIRSDIVSASSWSWVT